MTLVDKIKWIRSHPPRKDLTGCRGCKEKLLEAVQPKIPLCVYRGVHPSGALLCNATGILEVIQKEQCQDCQYREW